MAYGVIYLITNKLNGMKYVGQTTNLKRRIKQHKYGDLYIDNAIRKHGWKNFTVDVLEECANREQLNEREIFWIATLNCKVPNGYNRTSGGSSGWICTPESRAIMVAIKSGENNPFFGKHHTEKSRAQMSVNSKGIPKSPEHVAKSSATQRAETPFKNLEKAMIEQLFTCATLAKLMGLSRRSVSRKICGKIKFLDRDIIKLVEIFNKPIEYLLSRDDGVVVVTSNRGRTPYKNLADEMNKRRLSQTELCQTFGNFSICPVGKNALQG